MRWPWSSPKTEERQAINILTATDGRDVLYNSPSGWEVDQPALWWMGNDDGSLTWGNPLVRGDYATEYAKTLAAVQRCSSIICDTLAGLPWQVLRGWERLDTPDWITDPQALRLDERIVGASVYDVRFSAVEFWGKWLRSALWYGDGYVYCPVRGSNNQPVPPLWNLHPDAVTITDEHRYEVATDDGPVELPEGSILHLRGGEVHGDGHGTGVLALHGADLGLALSTRNYAGSQYRSGIPSGYLKSTAPDLQPDEAKELQAKWMAQHGRGAGRKVAVLNATTDFTPINISPLDAQLDSGRQWALRDIAIAFGVPPYMLGMPGDTSTYANVESRMIELRMFTLLPWARRIESVLDAQFARGTNMKIKTAGLERADTTTRFNAYKTALEAGFMTVDEVRALEDLPPLVDELTAEAAQVAATGGGVPATEPAQAPLRVVPARP